jgi:ubiquinone/menaquinone biosynthesis C-methylase UbiE
MNKLTYKTSLFDRIAPVYGLFYNFQKRKYRDLLDNIKGQMDLSQYKSILDIGCGTGALCAVLSEMGFHVTGIDNSKKMIDIAIKKAKGNHVKFIHSDASSLPFESEVFDICFASYVAHGMDSTKRLSMYKEIVRVTKHLVIFHDYNEKRRLIIDFAEWLEGGNYFDYLKHFKSEIKDFFQHVEMLEVSKYSSWYICKI